MSNFTQFCEDPEIACCQAEKELKRLKTENSRLHAELQAIETNARLIAAAPDMYEALEQCELFLCEMPSTDEQLLTLVQAAIIKAKGR